MYVKYLLVAFFICLSSHHIKGDLLDHLEDHLDHDDDLDEHFDDDHFGDDHFDDDFDDDDILEKKLLRRIEQFLPNQERPRIHPVSNHVSTNIEKSLGFGLPLIPANHQPINDISFQNNNHQISQSLNAPSLPTAQHEPPQQSFGVPLPLTVSGQPQHSVDIAQQQHLAPLNRPVEQPVVIVSDSVEDYDVDIPVIVDPAPLGFDPAHQDYDDIHNNVIGGQGRQLDDGQPSFAPNFDPFEGNYPRYAIVPRTSFSCGDQQFGGYYADTEADCQVFHICLDGGLMGSFLCPNLTLFNQALFVCDWWFNVDCSLSSQSYQLNARIGADFDSDEEFV